MEKWYIKEFSKLTNVTVRTLHHYDQIDLLKPSVRFLNGYRVYSEKDLIKLQQIVALRFFGFSLAVIKDIMNKNKNVIEHLKAQREHMLTQILHLQDASQTLEAIINDIIHNKENLYSPEMLGRFVQLQRSCTDRERAFSKNRWDMLLLEIKSSLDENPESPVGKRLARRWKNILDEISGNDPEFTGAIHISPDNLLQKFPSAHPEILSWIEKALNYEKRIKGQNRASD